jgi:hypothetical protein
MATGGDAGGGDARSAATTVPVSIRVLVGVARFTGARV